MAGIFKSENILKVMSCITFGVPLRRTSRNRLRTWLPEICISALLVVSLWFSFAFEMYCVKTYWTGSLKPQIPLEALLILISLATSGTVTYTLMVWYFYSNDFRHPHTRLVPHFDFLPERHQEDIGPTRNDWKYVNIFFLFGILIVILFLFCHYGLNIFFDFDGIEDFMAHIQRWVKIMHFFVTPFIALSYSGSVIACCIFFICCRDIVRHVQFTENLIITKAKDYLTARHYHECLLKYTDEVMSTTKLWFVIHTLFFMFIVLSDVVSWTKTVAHIHQVNDIIEAVFAQVVGSFLVAFKFAFPFLAASRVTARYDIMYRRINRRWRPDDLTEVDPFMCYAIRCQAGFTLFGIRLTAGMALISLLSCFLGIFKLYKHLV